MQIETEIKVEIRTTLGDNFSDDIPREDLNELVEQHIQEWCNERQIERTDVYIVGQNISGE